MVSDNEKGESFYKGLKTYLSETIKEQGQIDAPKQVQINGSMTTLPKWTCSCGQENRGAAKACINCGKAKE